MEDCWGLVYAPNYFVKDPSKDQWRCENNLTAVSTSVFSFPIGMPVSHQVNAPLSYWMAQLERLEGTTYLSYEHDDKWTSAPACKRRLEVDHTIKKRQLDFHHFYLPSIGFCCFAAVATILHCFEQLSNARKLRRLAAAARAERRQILEKDASRRVQNFFHQRVKGKQTHAQV